MFIISILEDNLKNINTKEYWDKRFKKGGNWFTYNGICQTKDFMECLVKELPKEIKENINGKTIADVGCGIASGCEVLKINFPESKISGIDFSDNAFKYNSENYDNFDFYKELTKRNYTCISSNVLEHVDNPIEYIKDILKYTIKYFIILVPENEPLNNIDEHIHSFDKKDFPNNINGFNKVFEKTIKTNGWMFGQLLLVYEKLDKRNKQ